MTAPPTNRTKVPGGASRARPAPHLPSLLADLLTPDGWAPYASLPPAAALTRLTRGLARAARRAQSAAQHQDEQRGLQEALRWLRPELGAAEVARQVGRYHRLQARRQAEELLLAQGDPDVLVAWARFSGPAPGQGELARLLDRGGGALVVSAHLGPMVYYPALLAWLLSRTGRATLPELLPVMNAPSSDLLLRQRDRFARHQRCPITPLVKPPGGELALLRQIRAGLERGAWVLLQLDVLSGGGETCPLPLAGRPLRLPALWGSVRLASRLGVPLLPVRAYRTRRGCPRLRIAPALASGPAGSGPRAETEHALARELAGVLETWLCADPADWALLPAAWRLLAPPGGP
ncbi:MAG: hypothetical protein RBU45_06160 [Myxococcota bacterium]|nr:hypothetical protein [Myxococcota bacterium]